MLVGGVDLIQCHSPQGIAVGDLIILNYIDPGIVPGLVLSTACGRLGDIEVFIGGSKKIFSWTWVHHIYKMTKT